jgi:hypothetical protein
MKKRDDINNPATKGDILVLQEGARLKEEKDEKQFEELNSKLDKMMSHIVFLMGAYKKFDEEHTVLSEHSREHEDRIEKLEHEVFKSN